MGTIYLSKVSISSSPGGCFLDQNSNGFTFNDVSGSAKYHMQPLCHGKNIEKYKIYIIWCVCA